jgi:hypothetical protein
MDSRMMPIYCPHGVCIDWGDFGPSGGAEDDPGDRCAACEEAAELTQAKWENDIRADERRRIADLLENHLTTFVGFAKDQASMVRLIAFTLRLDQ